MGGERGRAATLVWGSGCEKGLEPTRGENGDTMEDARGGAQRV